MAGNWKPQKSLQECHDKLTKTPGSTFEVEQALIDGRVHKVYKNIPPTLRHFWLRFSSVWSDREYLVYENDRATYQQIAERIKIAASVFRKLYRVRKGDRVGIVSRNYPEWVIAFWACQLLGAVAVAVNAWLPPAPLKHCITLTECKLLILDAQRAGMLQHWLSDVQASFGSKLTGILVVREHDARVKDDVWKSMKSWDRVMDDYHGSPDEWHKEPECTPEDPCAVFFSSGTTGLPKGVLSSHRGFLTNWPNFAANRARHFLRNDEPLVQSQAGPQSAYLIVNPLFHVMGMTTYMTMATAIGAKVVLMKKWDKGIASQLVSKEGITNFSGVPYTLMDLLDSTLSKEQGATLRWLSSGGASAPSTMMNEVIQRFPQAILSQGYGITETNGSCSGLCGMDYLMRPATAGLPGLVVDVIIMDETTLKALPAGKAGEIWIRGPNVMKGYYKDSAATEKVMTKDGWFRSGDLGYLDAEGFLYIKDRVKDIIIRGGENIDSTMVENAIYSDARILECAAVGVPDRKLGELVAVAVVAKEPFRRRLDEEQLLEAVKEHLPSFAVPVMVLELDTLPHNEAGKVQKLDLRKRLKTEWAKRVHLNRKPRSKL